MDGDIHFSDQYIYVVGSGNKINNVYVYDYTGTLKSTNISCPGFFEASLPNGDFITRVGKTDNYYRYSLSGQLVKAYTSRPLELGVAKSQPLPNGKYVTTITYDDRSYTVLTDWKYDTAIQLLRDENRNLYELSSGSVDKFSPCGKLLGHVDMPKDVVFKEENVTGREPVYMDHDLYGEPRMDIHGNVYTWKKTPNNYSILKWTWVDDPNAPSGPDAPMGLAAMPSTTGIYLTWTASPQDPGCVTGYEISRSTSKGKKGTTVTTIKPGTFTYTDKSASAGTTYYYKVRAKSGSDFSPYTAEVSGKR